MECQKLEECIQECECSPECGSSCIYNLDSNSVCVNIWDLCVNGKIEKNVCPDNEFVIIDGDSECSVSCESTSECSVKTYYINDEVSYVAAARTGKSYVSELQTIICENESKFVECNVEEIENRPDQNTIVFRVDIKSNIDKTELTQVYNSRFKNANFLELPSFDGEIQNHVFNGQICEVSGDDDDCVDQDANIGLIVGLTFGMIILLLIIVYVVMAFLNKDWRWIYPDKNPYPKPSKNTGYTPKPMVPYPKVLKINDVSFSICR